MLGKIESIQKNNSLLVIYWAHMEDRRVQIIQPVSNKMNTRLEEGK